MTTSLGAAFGKLESRLWQECRVRLSTKVAVYKAVVIATLLYVWLRVVMTHRRHVRSLHQFHMCCLRRIARIKWQDKIQNTEVLQRCGMMMVVKSRFVEHVINGPQTRCRSAEQVGLQMSSEHQWRELFAGRLANTPLSRHVRRMSDSMIPKATFYAELPSGIRSNCLPLLHFKDNLKANLLSTSVDPTTWEDLAGNRSKW